MTFTDDWVAASRVRAPGLYLRRIGPRGTPTLTSVVRNADEELCRQEGDTLVPLKHFPDVVQFQRVKDPQP